jgi:hypothetical protein
MHVDVVRLQTFQLLHELYNKSVILVGQGLYDTHFQKDSIVEDVTVLVDENFCVKERHKYYQTIRIKIVWNREIYMY